MNNKPILLVCMMIFLIGLASSATPHKQNTDLNISFTSNNATQCNITYMNSLAGSIPINQVTTKSGQTFNMFILSGNFTTLGEYCFNRVCTDGVNLETGDLCWTVTSTGNNIGNTQAYAMFGLLGITALFLIIGLTFSKEKWKIRTFFFIIALLMGVLSLNSIRIILGASTELNSMGETGLIIGIVVVSFMFLFMLINYTIEVFGYFKKKRRDRWDTKEYGY